MQHGRTVGGGAAAVDGPPTAVAPQATPVPRSSVAAEIERGVSRLFRNHGLTSIVELPLPDGRRADVVALGPDGRIVMVEIKSCLADLAADTKWPEYRAYCDALYFAVQPGFPIDALPTETGLILADRFGGAFEREAPEHALAPARRKAMLLRFARAAAARLQLVRDPDGAHALE